MRPDKHRQEEAELWLRDAQSDLALASVKKTQNMRYAHLCRYPGQDEIPISSRNHRQAVALAEATIRWAAQVALKTFEYKK